MKIQALTLQAKAPKQQDCLLITDHKAVISNEHQFDDDFMLAVADGIASSPYSGLVSKNYYKRMERGII